MIFVFDLGNVLIRWDRRLLYRKLIADPAQLDHFLDNVLTLEENAALDRGVPLDRMTKDLAERHPDHRELILAFADRWIETVGDVIEPNVAVLAELAGRGERCLALSNWGADTFAMVRDRYPWFEHFDGMVISGQVGIVKPDPAIFTLLCSQHGFEPAEALFIDDSAPNIAAAANLGFATLHLPDAFTLADDLRAQGLL